MIQNTSYKFSTQGSITIMASARSVWAVLADFHNLDKWAARASTVEPLGDVARGLGCSRRVDVTGVGTIEETVTTFDENKSIGYSVSPIGPIDTSLSLWTIEATGAEQCRATLCLSYNMKMGFVGRIFNRLIVGQKIASRVPIILSALKTFTETGEMKKG